ncbi:hypothetical protein Cgig2_018828 [Carnegiea gigantea]|uniref:RNase H type-1 domain-containing protein n=1 Tax=Carnegiea gigantea TaxID=171969 RepID=A0A9Q1KI71_9CARY|nr:hypothetical protein Cgig2_018828 [Carnegiea gigantea]
MPFHAEEVLEYELWAEFITVTWSVWGARNKYLFENKLIIAGRVWRKAINFLHDYQSSWDREKNSSVQEVAGWRRPDAGFCKLNFDAAKLGDRGYGWGVVVRDSEGDILLSAVFQGMAFWAQNLKKLEHVFSSSGRLNSMVYDMRDENKVAHALAHLKPYVSI